MEKDLFSLLDEHDLYPKLVGHQLRSRCPFTEKHEDGSGRMSMFYSPDINAYHCFSCKSKGKLTTLLTTRLSVSFSDAFDYVDIEGSITGGSSSKTKAKLFEDYYYELSTPEFYKKRGYPETIMRRFKVGEDSDWIVVPCIEDGRVHGYSRRNKKDVTNYSIDYKRGEFLYNRKKDLKSAIVVEGQADVWRIESWGLHSISIGGTEFGSGQLKKLKEYDELYFALDNDLAGVIAANKLYLELYKHCDIYFIEYEGEDPDKSNKKSFLHGYKEPHDYFAFKNAFMDILEEEN